MAKFTGSPTVPERTFGERRFIPEAIPLARKQSPALKDFVETAPVVREKGGTRDQQSDFSGPQETRENFEIGICGESPETVKMAVGSNVYHKHGALSSSDPGHAQDADH
jgi:hypothetical protein